MAARAVDLARAVSDDVLLLAGGRALPADADTTGLRALDDWDAVPGPLGGLGAGLEAARHDWCLLLACDMPFVDRHAVERLLQTAATLEPAEAAGAAPAPDVVAWAAPDGWQPFCALYRREGRTRLRAHAEAGVRSLRGYLDRCTVAVPEGEPTGRDVLFNVNTPADLLRARALAADGMFTDHRAGSASSSTPPAHRGTTA